MKTSMAVAAWALVAACGEIPQDSAKSFAGDKETKLHSAATFKGDKALYEKTLAERANHQDEYLRLAD